MLLNHILHVFVHLDGEIEKRLICRAVYAISRADFNMLSWAMSNVFMVYIRDYI